MKRIFLLLPLAILFSCGNDETASKEPIVKSDTTSSEEPSPTKTVWPTYALPVEFVDWSIGDTSNSKKVVEMYKAWDEKDASKIATYFSDSTAYDLPDGTRAASTKDNVFETFRRWRGYFANTSHQVIYALPLRSNDKNQDWVIAMVYNRWSYKDGARDSMLYIDQWRFNNGKIEYLNSLEQRPSKQLLRKLKQMK